MYKKIFLFILLILFLRDFVLQNAPWYIEVEPVLRRLALWRFPDVLRVQGGLKHRLNGLNESMGGFSFMLSSQVFRANIFQRAQCFGWMKSTDFFTCRI